MKPSRNTEFRNCALNPKCCYDTHDLECPSQFHPPLLSTSAEFCTEALAKGIPIPKCVLAKPKKLQIERQPPPLAKPTTSRHLKNWQRWCYIWRQTYNKLTATRNTELRPPAMSSGEAYELKKEDKELFDRTMHTYHLTGYYVKNAYFPDSIRPKACGSSKEITEAVMKRYMRDFPEFKRHRYPNYVRNEASLPPRLPPSTNKQGNNTNNTYKPYHERSPPNFNWEDKWAKTKYVEKMKNMLACDIGLYGKTDPVPDNLIFKQTHIKDGPVELNRGTDRGKKIGDLMVPQLVFSAEPEPQEEDNGSVGGESLHLLDDMSKRGYYMEQRGPVLRICSQFNELVMKYSKVGTDYPRFIGNVAQTFAGVDRDNPVENGYFYDEDHHFSITPKCKETKIILLKNEGTTAIRFQWFCNPPNFDAQLMLQDPTHFKHLRLDSEEQPQEKDEEDSNHFSTTASQSEQNPLKMVSKKPHLEFNFCSLPGVILPGQSLEFPIIFRSKQPGFFHETLYLLTHPRVVSAASGKAYAVRLSGVCTDIEIAEPGNELHEMEGLKRYLSQRAMEEETRDLMDSILDRGLWEATNSFTKGQKGTTVKGSSLPNGRATAESSFYSHNKDFYYHFGKSERAIELIHQLVDMLVPIERVETQTSGCEFSLQNLYNLVLSGRDAGELNWAQLRSKTCEELLSSLNKDCLSTLSQQRIFVWPGTERRKYTACYAYMVGTFDEVLLGFDRLHNLYNAPAIKLIDQRKADQLSEEFMRKEQEKEDEMLAKMLMSYDTADEMSDVFGETDVDNVPPLTDRPEGLEGMDEEEDAEEEEEKPYWLIAFEEMMKPYTPTPTPTLTPQTPQQVTLSPQAKTSASQAQTPTSAIIPDAVQSSMPQSPILRKSRKQSTKDARDGDQDGDVPGASSSVDPANALLGSGSGDAPVSRVSIKASTKGRRESSANTLVDTMRKQVLKQRRQVLMEARVKLFEDVMCQGIERMIATVDNFNNMLDYRDSDALVLIDDRC